MTILLLYNEMKVATPISFRKLAIHICSKKQVAILISPEVEVAILNASNVEVATPISLEVEVRFLISSKMEVDIPSLVTENYKIFYMIMCWRCAFLFSNDLYYKVIVGSHISFKKLEVGHSHLFQGGAGHPHFF